MATRRLSAEALVSVLLVAVLCIAFGSLSAMPASALSQASAGLATTSGPDVEPADHSLTLTGTFKLAHATRMSRQGNGFLIGGFSSTSAGEPDVVALHWVNVSDGFFSYWTLRLSSEHGLLLSPQNNKPLQSIDFARVTPVSNRSYTWSMGYDPQLGLLSIVVTDETSGKDIVSGGISLLTFADAIYPVAAMGLTSVQKHYVPVATRFDVGTIVEGEYTPETRLEPDAETSIRLSVPGAMPKGKYYLWIKEVGNGERTVLFPIEVNEEETFTQLPGGELSLGSSEIGVDYVDHDEVLLRLEKTVRVGMVSVGFNRVVRSGVDGPLATILTMRSESDIPSIQVRVWAQFTQLHWDEEAKAYRKSEPLNRFQVLEDILALKKNVPHQIAINFAPPQEIGTWTVDFAVELEPDILGYVTTSQWTFNTHRPAEIGPNETYTVAVFPDTQIYALKHPTIMFRQAEWLAANAAERNIAFALHVGDITNNNNPIQWEAATRALKLLDHAVPYVLALGNHDYVPVEGTGFNSREDTLVHQYFSVADFPNLVGAFPTERLNNTYHLFDGGGTQYLVISLEFAPPDEAIAWANKVIRSYPEHTVIILTHQYLRRNGTPIPAGVTAGDYPVLAGDPTTSLNDGVQLWEDLIRGHEAIRYVISGHRLASTIPYRVSSGRSGNRVYQFLINYQGEAQGGGGYLVLFEFSPDGMVDVYAYSPYEGSLKPGVDEFGFTNSLTIDLNAGHVTRRHVQ